MMISIQITLINLGQTILNLYPSCVVLFMLLLKKTFKCYNKHDKDDGDDHFFLLLHKLMKTQVHSATNMGEAALK